MPGFKKNNKGKSDLSDPQERIRELELVNENLVKRLRQTEDDLKLLVERYENIPLRDLFETMTEGVALHQMIFDDSGKAVDYLIIDVNQSFEKTLGIPVWKAKGSLGSQLYESPSPPYLDIYERVVRTGVPYFFKTYYPPMDRHFEISIFSPKKDWFATIFLDVTGYHNSQEELKKMKNELEQKVIERTVDLEEKVKELNRSRRALLVMVDDLNRTSQKLKDTQEELVRKERLAILGEFSGNISHELRNPLGVIDSSIYFLKMKLQEKDEKTIQHLDRISNSVKSAISIIENLLNMTRLRKPVLSVYDSAELLTGCLKSCSVPPAVELTRDFPEDPPRILAESTQFQMVVSNLVKNAVSAMEERGSLSIRLKRDTDKVVMSFSDTGTGISPANMEKIFQPLYTTKAKGFGLGLSITKMIVENHGGDIQVTSEPGKGSTFTLTFPQYQLNGETTPESQEKTT